VQNLNTPKIKRFYTPDKNADKCKLYVINQILYMSSRGVPLRKFAYFPL